MPQTYKLSECFVLHLDAGNDRNGNPRRVYCLTHVTRGHIATVDEGYAGYQAMLGFAIQWRDHGDNLPAGAGNMDRALARLLDRRTHRLPTTPAFRKTLLVREQKTRADDLVHGKATVIVDVSLEDE